MSELVAEGKIPHQVEMDKHPEKMMEGHMCESESEPRVAIKLHPFSQG